MTAGHFIEERRGGIDRRSRTWLALVIGSWNPRRRTPRRLRDGGFAAVDWHDARWLGIALLILLMSFADACLTLTLMSRGADELNPAMRVALAGSGRSFAMVKLGLTAGGVVLLTILTRVRIFGFYFAGFALYAVLGVYTALILYELWLLDHLSP
jgi:hypothetical protein